MQRDVRDLGGVGDLETIHRFVQTVRRQKRISRHSPTGIRSPLYFWRDRTGHEVDLVIDDGTRLLSVEIKAPLTLRGAVYNGLGGFCGRGAPAADYGVMVYRGEEWYPAARPHHPAVARVHLTARSAPWTELGRT